MIPQPRVAVSFFERLISISTCQFAAGYLTFPERAETLKETIKLFANKFQHFGIMT